jgi:hypothetical protein
MIENQAMTNPIRPLRRVRILHIVLVAIILATIPCYCLAVQVIRRAPVIERPTVTATVSPSGIPITVEATASRTPIPPYVTRTHTPVPPFFTPFTPTMTFTPEPTATNTPITPTATNTPDPTKAWELTQTAEAGVG